MKYHGEYIIYPHNGGTHLSELPTAYKVQLNMCLLLNGLIFWQAKRYWN
ncbi:hypothetical protein [Photobacterium kasasachensis]